MTEKELALRSLCERLTMNISGDAQHQIVAPQMLHVVDRRDRRSEEAMLGSEVFRFSHAMPNSEFDIIFCFRPVRPSSYRMAELKLGDLQGTFTSFYKELSEYMNGDPERYIQEYLVLFVEKQLKAEQEAKRAVYGDNWGIF